MAWKKLLSKQSVLETQFEEKILEIFSSSFSAKVIFLEGEMGAGKSTLARFLLSKYADIQEFQGSPSFPIVLNYRNIKNQVFEHIDLYRMESEKELESRGIVDLLWNSDAYSSNGFLLIEWMSKFPKIMQTFCESPPVEKNSIFKIEIKIEMESGGRHFTLFTLED